MRVETMKQDEFNYIFLKKEDPKRQNNIAITNPIDSYAASSLTVKYDLQPRRAKLASQGSNEKTYHTIPKLPCMKFLLLGPLVP